jgi:hypothetical protein
MRMWTARTTAKKAHQYVEHMIRRVFPSLRTMEGHQETYLLRRKVKGAIESALTLGSLWMLCEGLPEWRWTKQSSDRKHGRS